MSISSSSFEFLTEPANAKNDAAFVYGLGVIQEIDPL